MIQVETGTRDMTIHQNVVWLMVVLLNEKYNSTFKKIILVYKSKVIYNNKTE